MASASVKHDASERSKLGVLPMSVLIWYFVSGGPIGIEPAVRSGGYKFAIFGFLVGPLVWSIPEAIMTAELSTSYPEKAGGVVWVENAFGPFLGWMAGFVGWFSGAIDNAVYPVLILEYATQACSFSPSSAGRFVILVVISLVLSAVNWLGLEVVGKVAILLAFVTMSPFLILCIVGAFKIEPSRWGLTVDDESRSWLPNGYSDTGHPAPTIDWSVLINNLFWNFNSFDSAASFAADVDDLSFTLPRSLAISIALVFFGYILPLLVAIGALDTDKYTYIDWHDGFLVIAASEIVGPWLGTMTALGAAVSNIGLYQAEMSADSLTLAGMAERGYLPQILASQSNRGTPTFGLLVGTAVVLICVSLSELSSLVEMLNFNYGLSLLLEYAAFLALQRRRNQIDSSVCVVPARFEVLCMLVAPAILGTFAVLLLASWHTIVGSAAVNCLGAVLYFCCNSEPSYSLANYDDTAVEMT